MDERGYGKQPASAFERSQELQRQSLDEIPEGTATNTRGASTFAPYPMLYGEEGEGATVTDADGNEYVDLHCGFSAVVRGHAMDDQSEAVTEQLEQGVMFGTPHQLEHETASLVNDLVPSSDLTNFTCSGTEAVMSAIRLARAWTGRDKILTFEGMWHGHSDYTLMNFRPDPDDLESRVNPRKDPLVPGIPDQTLATVESIPWNDADALERKLEEEGDDIAAVLTEAALSNGGGLLWPDDGYLDALQSACRRHDVLFVLDEVVTGFRMGLGGAQSYHDLDPDLTILGKAMANGYPVAAVSGREDIMRFEGRDGSASFHGTYTGHPLTLAGAKANLERLSELGESGYEEFHDRGQRMVTGLQEVISDAGYNCYLPDFGGYTFVHFLEDDSDPAEIRDWRTLSQHARPDIYVDFTREMIGQGVLMFPKFGGRVNMTHAHTDEHVEEVLEAAKHALDRL